MHGGSSGSQGVLLYNTKKSGCNAVYGYYEADRIILEEGEYKELKEQQKEREREYKNEKDRLAKLLVILFLVYLAGVILTFVFKGFLFGLSALIFALGSYFPVLIIYASTCYEYQSADLTEQFRRFHGCEHQAISWLTEADSSEEATREKLEGQSVYDAECGTAYAGYALLLTIVVTLVTANILTLGVWKGLGIILVTVILLFVNIFNPYNPFLLIQRKVVAKPEEREYQLVLAVIEKLRA